jgi:hypothetical protein
MATTLMPLDPATSPQRAVRLLTIAANLLPEEIVATRRARRARATILVVLAVVVAVLGGWYAVAAHEKAGADAELEGLTTEATALQRSQNRDFADVVDVQSRKTNLDKQLKTLMANDLPWATLLTDVTSTGRSAGVTVTGINGVLTATADGPGATGRELPSTSTATTIGTLTVTGTGRDKPSIARFVEALGDLSTVANPYLTSATDNKDGVEYSLQVDITSAALCGRFTTTCKRGSK